MARLKLTLVLASGARIGPGKAALLESVRGTGSIAAAARAMDMDYKRAWLLIDSLNRAFDTPVVERVAGGPGGGRLGFGASVGKQRSAAQRANQAARGEFARANSRTAELRFNRLRRK